MSRLLSFFLAAAVAALNLYDMIKPIESDIEVTSVLLLEKTGGKSGADALARYAKARRAVVGLTGERDLVCDQDRVATIANGHPLMARVTAMGCAASALVGACLAVEPDAWRATVSALIVIGVAGEVAAARARGPGSFAVEILDAIHGLDRDALMSMAKVS